MRRLRPRGRAFFFSRRSQAEVLAQSLSRQLLPVRSIFLSARLFVCCGLRCRHLQLWAHQGRLRLSGFSGSCGSWTRRRVITARPLTASFAHSRKEALFPLTLPPLPPPPTPSRRRHHHLLPPITTSSHPPSGSPGRNSFTPLWRNSVRTTT